MRTRTKGSAKASVEEVESAKSAASKVQLGLESSNPPQLFILPKDISEKARIVTLEHPRYSSDSRYAVCPERGFYEFIKLGAPKATPRSWLLSTQESELANGNYKSVDAELDVNDANISKGYVTKTASMFVATPVDPLFFVLPALAPSQISRDSNPAKRLFLSGEDYFDRIGATSSHFKALLRQDALRKLLKMRMSVICDTVDAGDETMYRINEQKLLKEVLNKAIMMAQRGLPASMEDKLVRKALEVPMLSIKRDESFMHELLVKEEQDAVMAESGISTPATESTNSQNTDSTAATSYSEVSIAATSFYSEKAPSPKVEIERSEITAPEGVADLLRLQTAFSFICSNYLPPHLTTILKSLLSSDSSPTDFAPLETHLAHLSKLRQDALAARSLGDLSRKRSILDDDEDETRAEKKRKKEEVEKRRKAGESRGVKNLKKVNTTGMKKMGDFFKKKA